MIFFVLSNIVLFCNGYICKVYGVHVYRFVLLINVNYGQGNQTCCKKTTTYFATKILTIL